MGCRYAPPPVFYRITAIFGEISLNNPLVILAVYTPGIAGVFMIWRHYGLKGLGSYLHRLTQRKFSPIWADAQPWDNLLWVAVAGIIVWFNRRTMFKRGVGVTDLLMPEEKITSHHKICTIEPGMKKW